MPGIESLFGRERPPALFEGVILDDAAGPSDEVRVALVNFDESLAFGPAPWTPRGDDLMPERGMRALVAFSDEQAPWIVAFDPYST